MTCLKIAAALIFFIALFSCSSQPDQAIVDFDPIVQAIPDSISKYFEVITREPGTVNQTYFLYVSDISKIETVNNVLKSYYKPSGKKYLEIFYFDDKKAGNDYLKIQMDDRVSEKKKDALFKHFIAKYYLNPSNGASKFLYVH